MTFTHAQTVDARSLMSSAVDDDGAVHEDSEPERESASDSESSDDDEQGDALQADLISVSPPASQTAPPEPAIGHGLMAREQSALSDGSDDLPAASPAETVSSPSPPMSYSQVRAAVEALSPDRMWMLFPL